MRVDVREVVTVDVVRPAADAVLERADLGFEFGQQLVGIEALWLLEYGLLREKAAMLVDERRRPFWRQQRPPQREHEVHAQPEVGRFGQRAVEVVRRAGCVHHRRRAGDDAVAVRLQDAFADTVRPAKVVCVDDEFLGHVVPLAYRLSRIAYRVSPIAYRLSRIAYRVSLIACRAIRRAVACWSLANRRTRGFSRTPRAVNTGLDSNPRCGACQSPGACYDPKRPHPLIRSPPALDPKGRGSREARGLTIRCRTCGLSVMIASTPAAITLRMSASSFTVHVWTFCPRL